MERRDVMIDLETFSSDEDAVVVSIGAVKFSPADKHLAFMIPWAHGDSFYAVLPVEEQEVYGRKCSAKTVQWWLKQPDQARNEVNGFATVASVSDVLDGFERFMEGVTGLWGNGSDFDNVVLRSLYESYGRRAPWSHRQNRCFRTMKNLSRTEEPVRVGIAHHALGDATHQARWLLSMPEYR